MNKYIRPKYQQQWQSKGGYLDKDVAIKIVPSPTGGWDAISPLAAMEPQYAASIVNWVPRTGWVELRGGAVRWAKISYDDVKSLMTYSPPGGTQQLFAASAGGIWEVSDVAQPFQWVTGLAGDDFQYVNFTPAGGSSYLLAVNGADAEIQRFNGTTWDTSTITGAGSAIFANITVFKRRVWLVPSNSTIAYFLGTDAITGAATAQDLGPFLSKGGYLMAIGTWTLDGGNGPDDLIVFLSSQGQAVIYKGTDPTNALVWQLVGVFDLPKPIGRRCMLRLGSDLLIITEQGVLPLSQALPFDPSSSRSVAITNRIQNAILLAAQQYKSNFGWELCAFPQQSLILLNVPQVEGETQVQYVQNAITGAWMQFNGWNANCFGVFNDSLYYGTTDGHVVIAYVGGQDLGEPILCDLKCAFNYLEEPGRLKNANLIRPFLVADGTVDPTIQIDVDFEDTSLSAPVTTLTPSGAIWDTSEWDDALWSTGVITVTNWLSCTALGTALAVRMIVNLDGEPVEPPYPPNDDNTKIFLQFNNANGATETADLAQGATSAHVWSFNTAVNVPYSAQISTSVSKFGGGSLLIPQGNDAGTTTLLPFDGTDGGTTITNTGVGAAPSFFASGSCCLTTSQKVFGTASFLCSSAGSNAAYASNSAAFTLSASNFTIDCWFNCHATTSQGNPTITGKTSAGFTTGWLLRREGTANTIRFWLADNSVILTGTTVYTSTTNTGWHHVAVVRASTNWRLYIDGAVQASASTALTATVPDNTENIFIGARGAFAGESWRGLVDEFRFSKGVVRWADTFTPPSMPYQHSNYISTPDSVDNALGSGDWTIDFWFDCRKGYGLASIIAAQADASFTTAGSAWQIFRLATGGIGVTVSDGSNNFTISGTTIFANGINTGFHHCALVRTGNILMLFIDGVQEGSSIAFTGTVNNVGEPVTIGDRGAGSTLEWEGYVDEFRMTIGTALWIEDFTPPTSAASGLVSGAGVPVLKINVFELAIEYGGPI